MNRDSVRSPGPLSPRLRPGGPRTRRPNQGSGLRPATSELSEESAPAYSERDPPAVSSHGGSTASPVSASFESPSSAEPVALSQSQPGASELRGCREHATQTDSPTPATTRASTPSAKVIFKPPTLIRPSPVTFDSVPIAWRGMTLESAKWNMTSEQLQDIVSRAIRRTAQESFIRLLSVKTLDEELPAELERLETLRSVTQSQYRFNVQRRSMLLQSLFALAGSGDCDCDAICSLTTQLADVTSSCDRLMTELLHVVDQKAQIQRIQDVHVSSALAMALRKLNGSYAKRTMELREARARADQLKAELEEAWAVAQEMAQEMDELDNFHSGFSSEEDEGDDERRLDDSVRMAEVIGITGRAVATKATLTHLETTRNMEREYRNERARRVSAAKKRSSIASKASLRLPKSSKNSVADAASVSSANRSIRSRKVTDGLSARQSKAMRSSTLQIDTQVRKAPKDDSFLELAPTRPVSPTSPVGQELPPPLPQNTAGPSEIMNRTPSHAPQPSFDFHIPPINVHPADDYLPNPHPEESNISSVPGHATVGGRRPTSRRVLSLRPSTRRSLDDTASQASVKRSASEYRRFDAWPWPGIDSKLKSMRRQSVPLTTVSANASVRSGMTGTSGTTSGESLGVVNSSPEGQNGPEHAEAAAPPRVFSPPPRVFSPPQNHRPPAPPSTSPPQGVLQASPPPRVFSPPPKTPSAS